MRRSRRIGVRELFYLNKKNAASLLMRKTHLVILENEPKNIYINCR